MRLNRRQSGALLAALALAGGFTALHAGQREIAVLRSFDRAGQDLFTTLWVVEDAAGFLWVRAHRPDRKWLAHLLETESPRVELRRGERSQRYLARVFDEDASRAYTAPLFRRKYGLADRWREWTERAEPVPVRLREP